ncbi:MAG: SGNH/GDSL hydrolase family protein [Verrucomicrobiota bacterium]
MKPIFARRGALVAFLTIFATVRLVAETNLVEFQSRGGLPNVLAKLRAGGQVRVAYLGGSITAQPGWRPKTLKWFQEQFPAARVSEINAAIGGTGSDLGVFRLRRDVLDHQPDLLFVEFAVNDGGAAPEQIHRCLEGIVRQTWRAFPACDICFVYTLAGNMLESLQRGELPRSAAAMEQVAAHYGIPSINFGLEVARLEKEGKLVFKGTLPTNDTERAALGGKIVFSPDAVHPFPETGHELYLQAVVRAFTQMRASPGLPTLHPLPAPFRADNWEQAKLIPLTAELTGPGWMRFDPATNHLARDFSQRLPALWCAEKPGDTLTFRFRGTAAQVYDLLGPDCGQVRVTLDGKDTGLRPRFDAFCTYHRLGMTWIGSTLSNTVHTVSVTVAPDPLDKMAILAQRQERMDRPERFAGNRWYAGALLLVGDLEP